MGQVPGFGVGWQGGGGGGGGVLADVCNYLGGGAAESGRAAEAGADGYVALYGEFGAAVGEVCCLECGLQVREQLFFVLGGGGAEGGAGAGVEVQGGSGGGVTGDFDRQG